MKAVHVVLLVCAGLIPATGSSQQRGSLLIATERIAEEAFRETVVLLLHAGDDGAIGVAINRPTWVTTRDVFPTLAYLHDYRGRVYHGGPLAQATVLVLSRGLAPEGDDIEPVVDDVYMSSDPAFLEAGLDRGDDASVLRFYAGHASWRPQQLDAEIAAGAWRVVPANAATIFDSEPLTLWRRLAGTGAQLTVQHDVGKAAHAGDGVFATSR